MSSCENAQPSLTAINTNAYLYELRRQHNVSAENSRNQLPITPSPSAIVHTLPGHLGWGSSAFTNAIRDTVQSTAGNGSADNDSAIRPKITPVRIVTKQQLLTKPSTNTIKAYPSILSAMLRHNQAAAGRIWLLCRHLDGSGRGWIGVDELRLALTKQPKTADPSVATLALFGRRRLRQILGEGGGVFWERDAQARIWLFGTARVAANLGVARLQSRPVQLPVATLTGTMGQVRAHFYAAFHAGRDSDKPISRAAICEATGVPPRTQCQYEEAAGIIRQRNFTITAQWGTESAENTAFACGNAAFRFVDQRGRRGAAGATYLARQLPNSYTADLETCTRGRQRKVNTKLTDLVTRGAGERSAERFTQRFYQDGNSAATAFNSGKHHHTLFFPEQQRNHTSTFWHWCCA